MSSNHNKSDSNTADDLKKPPSRQAELELLEQEKIEDIVSAWERKLTKHVDDFKRYGRAIVEMDTKLFEYVEKLMAIQKQQSRLEERQNDVLASVDKLECRQKSMLTSLNLMEKRVLDRFPEGRQQSALEDRVKAFHAQIVDLDTEVLKLTEDLQQLEHGTYPDGLGQLLFLTNSHARAICRANGLVLTTKQMLQSLKNPEHGG